MSGGSYSYLYRAVPENLLSHPGVDSMIDRLIELNAEDAARELEEARVILRQAVLRVQVRLDRLRDVLKAVEWLDSCDYDVGSVTRALEEYRGGSVE